MKLNLLFLLYKTKTNSTGKCPLRCRITYNNKRKEFSTGIFINPINWLGKQQAIKLDNYYAPEELESALEKFVHIYNNERYHESLKNLTPADVYFGRGEEILKERNRLKRLAFENRRNEYLKSKKSTNKKNHLYLK
jgi:hypothetical protein